MRFGVVGLGRMGEGLATQALARGHSVVGFDVGGVAPELVHEGVESAASLQELVDRLTPPRFVVLYVPHGASTEKTVEDLQVLLARGDVLADGGAGGSRR